LQAAEGIPFAAPEIISADAFLSAAARAESPEEPDFARISAAAGRRQNVPLKNRGVRQSARRCRRNVRTFAEDTKRQLEIQNVSWSFESSADDLDFQPTFSFLSGRFEFSADVSNRQLTFWFSSGRFESSADDLDFQPTFSFVSGRFGSSADVFIPQRTIWIFGWRFHSSADVSNRQLTFWFSSGRFKFPRKRIFLRRWIRHSGRKKEESDRFLNDLRIGQIPLQTA
jgi:hypothetical protein